MSKIRISTNKNACLTTSTVNVVQPLASPDTLDHVIGGRICRSYPNQTSCSDLRRIAIENSRSKKQLELENSLKITGGKLFDSNKLKKQKSNDHGVPLFFYATKQYTNHSKIKKFCFGSGCPVQPDNHNLRRHTSLKNTWRKLKTIESRCIYKSSDFIT